VVGTPKSLKAKVPRAIPVEELELTVHPEREVPDVLWYSQTLRYSLVAQEHASPLIFVIAGTGAAYNSPKMQMLQRAFYQAGFHVVSLSSPTHPNFIVSASTTGIPGHLLDDSRDLYQVMSLVWLQLQRDDIEVTDFYLTGYSLGAAQAAFLSHLDENRKVFNFQKVLMINPPVNLYTSALILDEMLVKNLPGGENNVQPFFDEVFEAFAEVYREGEFADFSSDFLYVAYKNRKLTDSLLAALVGMSFRSHSANMIFTSDVFTNSGYIKPKNLVLSTSDSLTDYFKVANRVSFEDYFEELFAPYFLQRYPRLTKPALIESLGIKGIEEYLRQAKKIGLVHNADDVILGPGDLGYLQDVFGTRSKIFPRGGHCGNIDHKDFVAYILAFFDQGAISLSDEFDSQQASNPELNQSDAVGSVLLVSNEPSVEYPSHHFLPSGWDPDDGSPKPVAQSTSGGLDATSDEFSNSGILLAQSASSGTSSPATRKVSEIVRSDVQYPIDVYDPIEGFNRHMYKFNAQFDEYVFLPVVRGYETVTPDFIEDRVSNFFNNVLDIRNVINSVLQLKGQLSLRTSARFAINTTLGIGGLWDWATGWGFPQQHEDFGQTLGHYGVGDGPYLVLPLFGPSNVRDTTGFGVDLAARYFYLTVPLNLDDNTAAAWGYSFSNAVDTRHQFNFRYYQTGSPFEYDLVRLLYTKKRELDIGK